jgi:hypothetical protein
MLICCEKVNSDSQTSQSKIMNTNRFCNNKGIKNLNLQHDND